jgi:hypothetical protein
MARPRLTAKNGSGPLGVGPVPGEVEGISPAAAALVDDYLDRLASRLPGHLRFDREMEAELRDDLLDAAAAAVPRSPGPAAAAARAIAEFGDATTVAEALRPELAARLARRVGIALLVSGPLVGPTWVVALLLVDPTPVWRWLPLLAIPLVLVGAPAVLLTVAASSGRLARRVNPRTAVASGTVAGLAAGAGDAVLVAATALLLFAPMASPSALVVLAVAASLARLGFVARATPRLWGAARALTPPAA